MSAPTAPQNCSCEGDIICENCQNSRENQNTPPDNVRVSIEIPQETIISPIIAEILARLEAPGR